MRSMTRRLLPVPSSVASAVIPALMLLTVLASGLAAQTPDVEKAAEEVFERYETRSLAEAWQGSRTLEALGDDVIPWLRSSLGSEVPNRRLMAAKP